MPISGNWVNCVLPCCHRLGCSFDAAISPVLCYEYDCNILCHKNFVIINSLAYRLGHPEVIILLLLCY